MALLDEKSLNFSNRSIPLKAGTIFLKHNRQTFVFDQKDNIFFDRFSDRYNTYAVIWNARMTLFSVKCARYYGLDSFRSV